MLNIFWGSLTLSGNCLDAFHLQEREREREKGAGGEYSLKTGKLWLERLVKFLICKHGAFVGARTHLDTGHFAQVHKHRLNL